MDQRRTEAQEACLLRQGLAWPGACVAEAWEAVHSTCARSIDKNTPTHANMRAFPAQPCTQPAHGRQFIVHMAQAHTPLHALTCNHPASHGAPAHQRTSAHTFAYALTCNHPASHGAPAHQRTRTQTHAHLRPHVEDGSHKQERVHSHPHENTHTHTHIRTHASTHTHTQHAPLSPPPHAQARTHTQAHIHTHTRTCRLRRAAQPVAAWCSMMARLMPKVASMTYTTKYLRAHRLPAHAAPVTQARARGQAQACAHGGLRHRRMQMWGVASLRRASTCVHGPHHEAAPFSCRAGLHRCRLK